MRCDTLLYEYLERAYGTRTYREAKRNVVRNIMPYFVGYHAQEVTVEQVEQWHAELGKRGVYAANRALSYLSAAYNLAEQRKRIAPGTNPCKAVRRFPEAPRSRIGSPEELAELRRILREWWHDHGSECAFILCLMLTGARPSELLRASPRQLTATPDGGMLVVPGKMGQDRVIFFPPEAMEVLELLAVKEPHRERLCGLNKMPHKWWGHVRKAAGLGDLRMRDLRRTFGTAALQAGVPLSTVAAILGHSDLEITRKHYARVLDATLVAAVNTAVKSL